MTRWLAALPLLALAMPAGAETLREAVASAYATNPALAAARPGRRRWPRRPNRRALQGG